jgi:transposase InsO family protein
MRTTLVLDALRMALSTRERVEEVRLIHHSDRGSQYASGDYTQTLADNDVLASLGSTSDAYDNSMAESFLDSFKTELIADRVWRTHAQLELATVNYVGWFNHRRLHSSIGNRPPIEHEREYWQRVALGFEPLLAQAAPTVTDLRDVVTVGLSDG